MRVHAYIQVEDLERMLHVSTQSLEAAQQDLDLLKQQQEYYKAELDRNVALIEDLMDQIKQANVALVGRDSSSSCWTVLLAFFTFLERFWESLYDRLA